MRAGGSTPAPSFSPDERASAAALLLLLRSAPIIVTTSPDSESSNFPAFAVAVSDGLCCCRHCSIGVLEEQENEMTSPSSSSTSCCSSSCVRDPCCAVSEVHADPLILLEMAVRCIERKRKSIKPVRRARSIVLYRSNGTNDIKDQWKEQELQQGSHPSEDGPAASCLSNASNDASPGENTPFLTSSFSGSSPPPSSTELAPLNVASIDECPFQPCPPTSSVDAGSVATSLGNGGAGRVVMRMPPLGGKYMVVGNSKAKSVGFGSIGVRLRAKAIVEFLRDRGCTSEARIRAAVGDSPDTSKALRMLLKLDHVKRTGTGGRPDPFLYSVSLPERGPISHVG